MRRGCPSIYSSAPAPRIGTGCPGSPADRYKPMQGIGNVPRYGTARIAVTAHRTGSTWRPPRRDDDRVQRSRQEDRRVFVKSGWPRRAIQHLQRRRERRASPTPVQQQRRDRDRHAFNPREPRVAREGTCGRNRISGSRATGESLVGNVHHYLRTYLEGRRPAMRGRIDFVEILFGRTIVRATPFGCVSGDKRQFCLGFQSAVRSSAGSGAA